MDKAAIIKKVKEIILKYCKPERIYVYGSVINGEAEKTSDIDIAYDAPDCKNHHLIIDEIDKIETLIKIDVKNIALTEKRFYNRVKDTGKVIYSSSKKLRAEDSLHNFSNALKKFKEVIDNEIDFKQEGFGDMYLDILIKRFEFTYETAWKALKRYLDYIGISTKSPREVFKEAYSQNILKNEQIWLDMIEQRNLSAHIYDEYEVADILNKKNEFYDAFNELIIFLKSHL